MRYNTTTTECRLYTARSNRTDLPLQSSNQRNYKNRLSESESPGVESAPARSVGCDVYHIDCTPPPSPSKSSAADDPVSHPTRPNTTLP